ncbi:IS5 family transposase [Limosilactobacillus fermentum]|uniref:IS5 family transposase n=1 Tax=Limosilactobacillus fermentum TaxID=1613 RepID=UPI0039BF05C1
MHPYPSHVTREQFELIRPDLKNFRKQTRPRTVDLYDIFNAVLYVLYTGAQWRSLPHDFPKWKTVYGYFWRWSQPLPGDDSTLLDLLKKSVAYVRMSAGRSARTSFVILDAQSVKNTDSAKHAGYDGAKKINGIKRSIAVDINGLPIAIHITTADISERDSGIALFSLNTQDFEMVQRVMADGGYTGDNFASMVHTIIEADVIIAKQSDLKHGVVTPQRWIVERSFSWLGKWRRLWRNCERKLTTSHVMVAVAFMGILLRRL